MILARDVLYFPFIDIRESLWLRTALLTWETISTIVPSGYNSPYDNRDTIQLYDSGILLPAYVNTDYNVVIQAEEKFLPFLESIGARQVFRARLRTGTPEHFVIFKQKMSDSVSRKLVEDFGAVDLDYEHIQVDYRIGMIYMTLLASLMAKRQSQALWGHNFPFRSLAERFMCDDLKDTSEASTRLQQTLLASIAMQSIKISPRTSIASIIEFRERYGDERREFRNKINSLSEALQGTYEDKEEFQARCDILYKDHIEGALNDLRKALNAQGIVTTIGMLSIFALGRPLTLLSDIPTAASAAIAGGISVGTQYVNYRISRNALNKSPFSYVLHAERTFGRLKSRNT